MSHLTELTLNESYAQYLRWFYRKHPMEAYKAAIESEVKKIMGGQDNG